MRYARVGIGPVSWHMQMRKYGILFFFTVIFPLVLFAGYQLWQNNKAVQYPDRARMTESLNRGILWLEAHRDEILAQENPMLWWMVAQSAGLTQNPALSALFLQYEARYLKPNPSNVWQHLFYANATVPLDERQLSAVLPNYNLFFLYGLSCSWNLSQAEVIKQQLQENFCFSHHRYTPACITHQMIAVRFMQNRRCGDSAQTNVLVRALQDKIVAQLTWDARVVDVYFQRVLVLVESGAANRVKPIWIARVLEAQGKDGGWSGFQALIPIGSETSIGFSEGWVGRGTEKADFHATVQGVLIMSLLLAQLN